MGSINSVPVVSQVKSLVQVVAGDETGAKQTQEEFARTAVIVSQLNSLGHAIAVSSAPTTIDKVGHSLSPIITVVATTQGL